MGRANADAARVCTPDEVEETIASLAAMVARPDAEPADDVRDVPAA